MGKVENELMSLALGILGIRNVPSKILFFHWRSQDLVTMAGPYFYALQHYFLWGALLVACDAQRRLQLHGSRMYYSTMHCILSTDFL